MGEVVNSSEAFNTAATVHSNIGSALFGRQILTYVTSINKLFLRILSKLKWNVDLDSRTVVLTCRVYFRV